MDLCRGVARRVVALSSMDVYRAVGVTHQLEPGPLEPLPLHEGSALRTRLQTYPPEQVRLLQRVFGWLDDEYDKIPVEQAVLGDPELPGTVLRLPMIYGPGDPLHRLFALLKRMDDRRPVILLQENFASWRGTRGSVENIAAAVTLAVTSDAASGRVYNVGEREYHSELEWAARVAAVVGWTGELRLVPGEKLPPYLRVPGNTDQHWVVDSSRLRDELGYTEPVTAEVGLRRTIEWERANPPPQLDPTHFDYEAEDACAGREPD
jgi:nucleoside-diphosphate-sugar epimerase